VAGAPRRRVAPQNDGALLRQRHHPVQQLGRLRAVADQVAEQRELRRTGRARVRQAGVERAHVGMQVGKQRPVSPRHHGAKAGAGRAGKRRPSRPSNGP
jgi:hypothetical protein